MHFFATTRQTNSPTYSTKLPPALPFPALSSMRRERGLLSGYFLDYPYRSYMMALSVAIVLSVANAWAQDGLPTVQQQGDVTFVSGGIGSDESDALRAVKGDYNLRIISADKDGHFRGDTQVVVSDMKGNVLLDTMTQGPLLYANLPDGRYIVEGSSEGQTNKQTIRIATGKNTRVHFSWVAAPIIPDLQ
jgi:hypothetical protein